MKIIIILPDLCGGGAERIYVDLAKDWIDNNHSVDFILMRKKGELLSLMHPKINILEFSSKRIRNFILPLVKYLMHNKPDIILSSMWPLTSVTVFSWLLSGRKGKLFLSEHVILSTSVANELFLPLWAVSVSLKITYPLASGIIAVSKIVKNDLCSFGKIPCEYIKLIYNPAATGVETYRASDAQRNKLWDGDYESNILSVGALKFEKDHKTLIQAFSYVVKGNSNAKLVILGDGPLRGNLEDLILQLGLKNNVELPGFILNPYPWYRSADLFVLSSLWEGFGNVIVEALECGVPIVSTDSGGPTEILKHGFYGKLVPVGDSHVLALAINESLRKSHNSSLLMNRAKDFTLENISKQYLHYFISGNSKLERFKQ